MKKITTTRVGKNFAEAGSVGIELTPNTLLLFEPAIHPGGVRGKLIRYKKKTDEKWKDLSKSDFIKTPHESGSKIEIELGTEALKKLTECIEQHAQIVNSGISYGKREYIVAEKEKVLVIDDTTKKAVFDSLLAQGYTDEFWNKLKDNQPHLADHIAIGHVYASKMQTVQELRERLHHTYHETKGGDSWQDWIYKNNWLFGVNYVKVIEKTKINITGIMPDFLFLTADNFVDVLEIKLPSEAVIVADRNHPGSYKWCPVTNEAIGQVVSYLSEIERQQLELQREILRAYKINVSFVKPRGFILIGDNKDWDQFKKEGLRKLNFSLHGIEILTYSDLAQRGTEIARMYTEEI